MAGERVLLATLEVDGSWPEAALPPSAVSGSDVVHKVEASGAAQTIPAVSTATLHDITLTANCTLTFPAAGAGQRFTVWLTQDGTGGRTVTWPADSVLHWAGGGAPPLSSEKGAVDALAFASKDGTVWYGAPIGFSFA